MTATTGSVEITPVGPNLWAVTLDGEFAAGLRWSGEHMRLVDKEGEHLGDLFRSDGVWIGGEIVYMWRSYRPGPLGARVARGATQKDAVAALLDKES